MKNDTEIKTAQNWTRRANRLINQGNRAKNYKTRADALYDEGAQFIFRPTQWEQVMGELLRLAR